MSPARFVTVAHIALFIAAVGVIAVTSRVSDWQPPELVFLLVVLAVVSDAMAVEVRGLRLSGSFIALVLAMALLGPAPAVAIGILSMAIDALRTTNPMPLMMCNLATLRDLPARRRHARSVAPTATTTRARALRARSCSGSSSSRTS